MSDKRKAPEAEPPAEAGPEASTEGAKTGGDVGEGELQQKLARDTEKGYVGSAPSDSTPVNPAAGRTDSR